MTRRMLLAGLLMLALAPASIADARTDEAAKRFLESIYKPYVGTLTSGTDYTGERKARRFFTPDTVRLMERESRASRNEPGRLNFDVFANAQDWVIPSFTVAVESTGLGRARGTVRFTNQDRPTTVTHELVRTRAGWRIHDLRWSGSENSLRSLLTAPRI